MELFFAGYPIDFKKNFQARVGFVLTEIILLYSDGLRCDGNFICRIRVNFEWNFHVRVNFKWNFHVLFGYNTILGQTAGHFKITENYQSSWGKKDYSAISLPFAKDMISQLG